MRQKIRYILIIFFLSIICGGYVSAGDSVLKWDASTGDVSGYIIYYGIAQGNYPFSEDVGNVTEYALSNFPLSEGTTYYFVVRAYNATGESGDSNVTIFSVPDAGDTTPPLPPQGVAGEIVDNDIVLTWLANSEPDFSVYRVYYGISSRYYGSPIPVDGTEYSISWSGADVAYYFAVTAVDASGNESGYSSPEIQKTIMPVADTQAPSVVSTIVDTIPPVVTDTQSPVLSMKKPTKGEYYFARKTVLTLSGTASDNIGVKEVRWVHAQGGSGVASGTSSWEVLDVPLVKGSNNITIIAEDEVGNTTSYNLNVFLWEKAK